MQKYFITNEGKKVFYDQEAIEISTDTCDDTFFIEINRFSKNTKIYLLRVFKYGGEKRFPKGTYTNDDFDSNRDKYLQPEIDRVKEFFRYRTKEEYFENCRDALNMTRIGGVTDQEVQEFIDELKKILSN
jgi:hypothetical protein